MEKNLRSRKTLIPKKERKRKSLTMTNFKNLAAKPSITLL